jgi:threonyl-tRNA synthetase
MDNNNAERKDHYIPQVYLKNWQGLNVDKKKHVWVYDKNDRGPRLCPTRSFCFNKEHNTVLESDTDGKKEHRCLEIIASYIENNWDAAIKNILDSPRLLANDGPRYFTEDERNLTQEELDAYLKEKQAILEKNKAVIATFISYTKINTPLARKNITSSNDKLIEHSARMLSKKYLELKTVPDIEDLSKKDTEEILKFLASEQLYYQ